MTFEETKQKNKNTEKMQKNKNKNTKEQKYFSFATHITQMQKGTDFRKNTSFQMQQKEMLAIILLQNI